MSEYSTRMNGLSGSATREILKLTALPDMISFAGGLPATQCLPVKEIREITADILSGAGGDGRFAVRTQRRRSRVQGTA